jgi:hypothetical protein
MQRHAQKPRPEAQHRSFINVVPPNDHREKNNPPNVEPKKPNARRGFITIVTSQVRQILVTYPGLLPSSEIR